MTARMEESQTAGGDVITDDFAPVNLYDTLDFKPDLIAQAIQMGRDVVNDRWAELEQFLGV